MLEEWWQIDEDAYVWEPTRWFGRSCYIIYEQFLEIELFYRFVVYSHNPIEYKWFGDLQKRLLLCHGA